MSQGFEQGLLGEKEPFHGITQIGQKMPAISHLPRFRRSLSCPFRKRASAIPADHLHARMGKQPFFQRLGFSIRKQVDGNLPFEVDEDSSIAPPAAKTNIIDAEYPRRRYLALHLGANQPQ